MNVTCFASYVRGSCSGSNPEMVVLCHATAGVNFGALGAKSAFPELKCRFWTPKGAFAPKMSEFCSFLHFCARRCSLAQNDLPDHQYSCSHSYVFACCARRCQKVYSPQFSVFLAASCIFVNTFIDFSKNMIFYSSRGPEAIWARKTKGLERPRRDVFS